MNRIKTTLGEILEKIVVSTRASDKATKASDALESLLEEKAPDSFRLHKLGEALKSLNEGNAGVYYGLGLKFFDKSKYRMAEIIFERIFGLKPDKPERISAYLGLSACCYLQDRREEAEHYARKAIELEPTSEGYLTLGICCFNQKKLGEAELALNKAIELDADNHFAYCFLGKCYMERKFAESDFSKGLDYERKAVDQFKRASELGNEFAKKEIERIRYSWERAILNGAIKSEPENADLYYKLGDFCSRYNQPEKAKSAFQKALELADKDTQSADLAKRCKEKLAELEAK